MFQPEGRNSERLEHGWNSLFLGCCAHVPPTEPPNKSYIYSNLLFSKVGTVGTVGTRGENTCVPTVCLPRQKSLAVGTPGRCPSRQRWAQVRLVSSRTAGALYRLWLWHYLDAGDPYEAAHTLARRTCRALYPEVSRGL